MKYQMRKKKLESSYAVLQNLHVNTTPRHYFRYFQIVCTEHVFKRFLNDGLGAKLT